jgi:hypothetical protein
MHLDDDARPERAYHPPRIVLLGDLASLTLVECNPPPANKTFGPSDGCTFLGIDIGSI